MTEEELIKKAKMGDNNAINDLMVMYKPLVNIIARRYFLVNSTMDDIVQEGMLGLFKAFLNYDLNSGVLFKTYATTCINRQIQTAVTKNNRNKNVPLNTYFSINNQGKILLNIQNEKDKDDEDENGFFLVDTSLSPEDSMLFKEKISEINNKIETILSSYEKNVLKLYMLGLNYVEIAQKIKKEPKSVDNALSRIKIKLKEIRCI